jgi:NADH-quinone oxidoreductase subunit I
MALRDFIASLLPVDLFKGLMITGGYLFRRKETVQYPEKKLEPTDRFRGMFGYDGERCIDCGLCAKACPIQIIYLADHTEKDPDTGKKKKVIDRYDIDVKRCMFCGLCEEACPTEPQAIWLTSKSYEGAVYERNEGLYFTKDRLASWEGVEPFPGVPRPQDGQVPGDALGRKSKPGADGSEP